MGDIEPSRTHCRRFMGVCWLVGTARVVLLAARIAQTIIFGLQTLYKTGKVIVQLFAGLARASHCEDAHRTIDTPGYRVNAF